MRYQKNKSMKVRPLLKHNQHFMLTTDRIIRAALRAKLEESCEGDADTRIIEELGINHGAARVDIEIGRAHV